MVHSGMARTVTKTGLLLALTLCAAWSEWPGTVRAQSGRDEVGEARALFMAGRSAYTEGRYLAALEYFERSYQLSGKPRLLYNIGQCHDRLRNDKQAVDALQRYLKEMPEAENRREVEARLLVLRAAVRKSEAERPGGRAASTTYGGPEPSASEGARSRSAEATGRSQEQDPETEGDALESEPGSFPVGPVLTIAGGAGLGLTGAVLMLVAGGQGDDVEQAPVGSSYDELQQDLDGAERNWIVGQVLIGVGAAAAAGGIAWLLLEGESGGESAASADRSAVTVTAAGNGLIVRGRF